MHKIGDHIYAPLNIFRRTYTESDQLMSLLVQFELDGDGGLTVLKTEECIILAPNKEVETVPSTAMWRTMYTPKEGRRPWKRKVLEELRLQSQCFLQCFGYRTLSSRELWQRQWVL